MQTVSVVGGRGTDDGGAVATGASQDVEVARERLELELDSLRGKKEPFLGFYEVCAWALSTQIR